MMMGEGLLNKQIAYELSVSEATVKAHVSAVLQKLGVENRTKAVLAAGRFELGQWRAEPGASDLFRRRAARRSIAPSAPGAPPASPAC